MQSCKEVFEKPPRTLCSPGTQLLQADPGSTLRLLRLRSGKADRLGEENLPSGRCGSANWEPWGQPGAPPGHPAGFSGRHLGSAGRLSLRYPQVQTSVMEPKVFSEMSFFIPSPPISLCPPLPPLKELREQCSEP